MARKKAEQTPDQIAVAFDEAVKPKPNGKRKVTWTELGEQKRAHSEYGTHVAGETVETVHADALIERGFAVAA